MKNLLFLFGSLLVFSSLSLAEPQKGEANYFKNCTQLRNVYPNGVQKGHKAYRRALDRDRDGWACER